MVRSRNRVFTIISCAFLSLCLAQGFRTAQAQANVVDGFGQLKFGMTPSAVEALEGCSSEHECLYNLLGKNRYFTLSYGSADSPTTSDIPPSTNGTLTRIDIDMGNHTKELFGELYEILASQFPVIHIPTKQEDKAFQNGKNHELIVGFAEGSVLLKMVRRPFGNMIIRVVYQNESAAKAQRERWDPSP